MITEHMRCDACGKAGYCGWKSDFKELDELAQYLSLRVRGTIDFLAASAAPCPHRKPDEESPEG